MKNWSVNLNLTISFILKGLIIFLPLFFLPWTVEFFESSKQHLLWLVLPTLLIAWLFLMVKADEIRFSLSPLTWPIIIFLVLTLINCLFSQDWFSSIFGYWGRFSDAWLGLASLVIFYFLVANFNSFEKLENETKPAENDLNKLSNSNFSNAQLVCSLLKIFFYSLAVIIISGLLSIFGFWSRIINHQAGIFSSPVFNLVGGSLEALAVFSSIGLVLLVGGLANFKLIGFSQKEKWFFYLVLLFGLTTLALINFSLSWYLLAAGCGLLILLLRQVKKNLLVKLLPILIFLVSLFFIFSPANNLDQKILGQNLPKEANLNFSVSWQVASQALKSQPMLGAGLGTFAYDFSLFRPADFNQSVFWQYRFDKSPSYLLELLATSGSLVFLSYFLIISLSFYLSFIFIKKLNIQPTERSIATILIAGLLVVFLASIFYLNNTSLLFLFWFILALMTLIWQKELASIFQSVKFNFSGQAKKQRLIYALLVLLSTGWLVLAGLEIKYWLADVVFAQNIGQEKKLITAIKLNPHRSFYQITLAKYYLNQTSQLAHQPGSQQKTQLIQQAIENSLKAARQATETSPNSVASWETLAMVYREIKPYTQGSEPWAVKAFETALALEPTNPVLASELAQAYLNNQQIDLAEKYFYQAILLKNDYDKARFGLAKVYLAKKQDKQAKNLLEDLAKRTLDPEIYFELGRFYYNQGQIDQAIEIFKKVIQLSPQSANAYFSLGLAYQTKGERQLALNFFQKVLELNPGDTQVEQKIRELR